MPPTWDRIAKPCLLWLSFAARCHPPMATDHIRYDILVQDAMRSLVRTVLTDAARKGLPGDHHFYVSFDTQAEGVRLSQRLRAQYPAEMTIVLQHQFWDLLVNDDGFELGLSFGGVPERLGVPFAAIKGSAAPSVQFAVQFEELGAVADKADASEDVAPSPTTLPNEAPGAVENPTRTTPAITAGPAPSAPAAPAGAPPTPTTEGGPDKPSGGGEVVRF